ncbi:hypothetical protein TWF506_002933 [Arthrobotrys conoides]|uniref:peptidylprolyl isomerase n=1 Tax=Arthrobotrys conoides TaxID=74498 RepID=A0AAN8N4R2_9PEZI
MSSPHPPDNHPPPNRWEPFKKYIHRLYLQEGKSFSDVVSALSELEFDITLPQAIYQIHEVWQFHRQVDQVQEEAKYLQKTKRKLKDEEGDDADPEGGTIPDGAMHKKSKTVIPKDSESSSEERTSFRVRVITPQLARSHKLPGKIPVLLESFSGKTLLRELILAISVHLQLPKDEATDNEFDNTGIDIWISDYLIEAKNRDATIEELGILDLLADGILDVYAITRNLENSTATSTSDTDSENDDEEIIGIGEIFSFNPHWQIRPQQSDRGSATFLSSFRVFAHCISSREMTASKQEAILRVIYGLTRFFPILKSLRILMSGQSLSPAQSALCVQCFYELLKELIPKKLVGDDESRLLEGSRLLFGYILEISRLVDIDESDNLPLQDAFKTVDLSDATTSKLIKDPVLTDAGLVDASSIPELPSAVVLPLPANIARIFKLTTTDGCSEYSYFDTSEIQNAFHFYYGIEIDPRMTRDPHYLAGICEACGFVVTLPGDLAKASAPCLTFDSTGHVAVYTGRAPCADPGKDFQIFLPLSGKEITVDVAVITGLLGPILEARKNETGGSTLDAVGIATNRKQNDPEELVMFVVDCSQSMNDVSEFYFIDKDHPCEASSESSTTKLDLDFLFESMDEVPVEWAAKKMLKSHESFEDMVATVRAFPQYERLKIASKMIEYNSKLSKQEVKRLIGPGGSKDFRKRKASMKLVKAISKLQMFKFWASTLADVLITEAAVACPTAPLEWVWPIGSESPEDKLGFASRVHKVKTAVPPTPDKFICPITKELFRDPIVAADGFTYERRAIERWFATTSNKTYSPSTGGELTNTQLRANVSTSKEIEQWMEARDIIDPISPGRLASTRDVTFQVPGGVSFTRTIDYPIKLTDLYYFVYRGLGGKQKNFKLVWAGDPLAIFEGYPCSSQESNTSLSQASIEYPSGKYLDCWQVRDGDTIIIEAMDAYKTTHAQPDFHLVKVYEGSNFRYGYWLDRREAAPTVSSLIFKTFRFQAEKEREVRFQDFILESNFKVLGDGWYRRQTYEPYDELRFGSTIPPSGTLRSEGLLETTAQTDRSKPAVFKVCLETLEGHKKDCARKEQLKRSGSLNRLEVCKQIFSSFVNRTLAYNYANHYGLITFDSFIRVAQTPTYVMEDFRSKILRMEPSGNTMLWDALDKAIDELESHGKDFPKARKRIICLSDGEDTGSKTQLMILQDRARKKRIVIDSFCIGKANHENLMRLSQNTGGYKFKPTSLEEAMDLGELEPVLSLSERFTHGYPSTLSQAYKTEPDGFPRRKEHPNTYDRFTRVGSVSTTKQHQQNQSKSSKKPGLIRTARILSELRKITENPHPSYDVFVSDENMGFWKIVMQGPSESAYETGAFVMYLDMGEDYPLFPPEARFLTEILHPNINKHGKICHSILDRNWTADTSNAQLLNTIWSLLSTPEVSDPVNTVLTLDYHWDEVAFRDRVKNHIQDHAKKTRKQLVTEFESRPIVS